MDIKVDESKMPQELKNDVVRAERWRVEELGRLNAEQAETPETPETTETPEPPSEEKAEINFTDFAEYGVKSVDEIKEALKERSLTKTERDALKQELETAKAELVKKPKTSFKNKELYKLDKVFGESPEKFELFKNLKFGKTDPFEILKMDFINSNPEFKDRVADVELLLKDKYGLDKVLDEDATETEKANFEKTMKLHRIQMETDSKNAKNNLLTEYDNIEVPDTEIPKDEKTLQAEEATLKESTRTMWSGVTKELSKGFTKFPVKLPKTDDKGNIIKGEYADFIEYEIPKELASECAGAALEYIVENKLIPKTPEEGAKIMQTAIEIMNNVLWRKQTAEIILAAVDKGRSLTATEYEKMFHNPSAGKKSSVKGKETPTTAKETEEAAAKAYLNR